MVDVIIVAILVCIIGGILFYLYRAKNRGSLHRLSVWQTVHRTYCGRHGQETKHKKKH
ncbi:MAG: hypothetical protein ACLR1T_01900 [Evtepia gabavorous]